MKVESCTAFSLKKFLFHFPLYLDALLWVCPAKYSVNERAGVNKFYEGPI